MVEHKEKIQRLAQVVRVKKYGRIERIKKKCDKNTKKCDKKML